MNASPVVDPSTMTEHDDKENTPVELLRGRETQSGMWFRLGAFFLAALMFISLFLVGGSLSIITSSGNVSTSGLSLKVAKFDKKNITVKENSDSQNEPRGDNQRVIYAFDITNKNEVDITYDMELDIKLEIEYNQDPVNAVGFILVDDLFDSDERYNGNYIDFFEDGSGISEKTEIKGSTDPYTDTEHDWPAFYLEKGTSTTVLLIADCKDLKGAMGITVSGSIFISKITQAGVTE